MSELLPKEELVNSKVYYINSKHTVHELNYALVFFHMTHILRIERCSIRLLKV